MRNLLRTFVLPALLVVACTKEPTTPAAGNPTPAAAAGVLAGNWSQDTGSDAKGMTLEFDGKSDKVMVHTAPRADGSHDHLDGTYTFDAGTKAVTVKCELMGKGKAGTWTGTLAGEAFELTGGTDKVKFKKGGSAH